MPPRSKNPLERNIEAAVNKYAKEHGVKLIRKMNGLGNVGWPDRMYLYDGAVLFIEFKRRGCKPTEIQELFHRTLREAGFVVGVVDDVAVGKMFVKDWLIRCGVENSLHRHRAVH